MAEEITVIHEASPQKPYFIIDKAAGLPSAPLNENDTNNAFYQAAKLYPQLLKVQGKKAVEHGLLHRLDTATSGLMIIAATQECYDFLQEEQNLGKIIKTYTAECNLQTAFPEQKIAIPDQNIAVPEQKIAVPELVEGASFTIQSYFRAYGPGRKEVRPVTSSSNKAALQKVEKQVLYTTEVLIKEINHERNTALVECTITKGYRHQIRCHLAWYGLPIINDIVYNPLAKNKKSTEEMHFCASKIQFEYPEGDLNSYVRKNTWT